MAFPMPCLELQSDKSYSHHRRIIGLLAAATHIYHKQAEATSGGRGCVLTLSDHPPWHLLHFQYRTRKTLILLHLY
jgi:hypothetical protein